MAKKRVEGDKKYFRILNIISRLNTGPVKISELALEFDISIRSVQRDLERINMTGFALDSFQKGVYQFAPGISLRDLKLSNEQLSVLVLMHDMAAQMGGTLKTAFDKLFSRLTSSSGFDSPFHAILQRARQTLDPKIQKDLEFAIENGKKIKITYESLGKKSERELCPLKLIFSDGFFYLLAAKTESKKEAAFVKYRADKIKKLDVLGAEFLPPPKKVMERLLDGATSIWGVTASRGPLVRLRLEGPAADFFKSKEVFPRQKIIKETSKCLILESPAAHPMEIIPHVLQWLPDITVLEPDSIKTEIKNRIAAYLRKPH
ncbi:MAG: WYL domain-containing protein [Elusimicrobia bacterium]|nr:WYL domain-containing protein [Elusimicrobiota bacterium]